MSPGARPSSTSKRSPLDCPVRIRRTTAKPSSTTNTMASRPRCTTASLCTDTMSRRAPAGTSTVALCPSASGPAPRPKATWNRTRRVRVRGFSSGTTARAVARCTEPLSRRISTCAPATLSLSPSPAPSPPMMPLSRSAGMSASSSNRRSDTSRATAWPRCKKLPTSVRISVTVPSNGALMAA